MEASFIKAAEIATRQHGRITTAQLHECGIGKSGIERGVAAGRLHRLHVGVYALGHLAPGREEDWHAAVLACGDAAVLSHRCAAAAWGIRDGVGSCVDVTVPPTSARRRPGIAVHRGELLDIERDAWSGIPITSAARTMVDLAHFLRDPDDIEWAVREMQFRRLFERGLLEISNQRRPNATLTRVLDELAPTGSRLEVAFLSKVIRRHGLPLPQCQKRVEGFRVDFLWPQERLIVEIDGAAHDQPAMRKADAIRDNILHLAGYLVLRYRWAEVHRHHERTAAQIRVALMNRASI